MKLTVGLASFFLLTSGALANNLHLIESRANGFALYRTGAPDKKEVKELCDLGIQEIMVLSGDAEKHELKYQDECPTLKVIYNEKQSDDIALTKGFLNDFDTWVTDAQATGKKIAFRCVCGCHRTGRLAAYYQMKYQNITSVDAIAVMNKHGKVMFLHQALKPQVRAMQDHLQGRACSQEEKYCLKD